MLKKSSFELERKKKLMKRRKWRWWLVGGAIFILLFGVAAEFTSRSSFCSVCHYMKPFYDSWKQSSHGQIECQVCHYPPGLRSKFRAKIEGLLQVGRYWTKLYLKSKPWAEIPDEACLRPGCHDKRFLEGKVKFKTVIFDHKIHFEDLKRGKRLRCTSCHSQIVQGEHITVTESSCFICHFKPSDHYPRIADCLHCHSQENLLASKSRYDHQVALQSHLPCERCHVQVFMGDGIVPKENCYKCHFERDRLERYEETDLMHSTHITAHKIECNQCHLEIQHKIIKDIEVMADCRTCHLHFHEPQKILYSGKGGKGIGHPSPSIKMAKGLSCQGCHVLHEEVRKREVQGETLKASGESCETCHGQGFSRLLNQWKEATAREISQVRHILARAQGELIRAALPQKREAEKLLQEAAFNLEVVDKGKAVHNIHYSLELLKASLALIQKAMEIIGSDYKPPEMILASGRIPSSCANCHQGIESIKVKFFSLHFDHQSHLEKTSLQCESCHSLTPKHGTLIATKNSCASCHHERTERDCATCHQVQLTVYKGGDFYNFKVKADSMADAGVNCQDCHPLEKGRIKRWSEASCSDCHDKDYLDQFKEKQKEIQLKIEKLSFLLEKIKKNWLGEKEKKAFADDLKLLTELKNEGSLGAHNLSFYETWLSECLIRWTSHLEKRERENQ